MDDGLIEVQPALRVEGVYDDVPVHLPGLESRYRALGEQPVRLDAAPARIVARYDDLASEEVVREPDLVLWEEPVGVVAQVELSKGCAWIGRRDLHPGDVVLDMPLPCQVGFGV